MSDSAGVYALEVNAYANNSRTERLDSAVAESSGRSVKMPIMNIPDPVKFPLCDFFLSGYLAANPEDTENFPTDQPPDDLFWRYEALFNDALFHLRMSKESLRAKQEFNFESGNANNLEGALGVLRAATHLGRAGFSEITLIKTKPESSGADLTAKKNSRKICFEIKTITKRSKGRDGLLMADQFYEKIKEG